MSSHENEIKICIIKEIKPNSASHLLYMAQYAKTSNQEMIWNTFRKISEVAQFTESEQNIMFSNAISHFYHQINPNMTLSRDQLQDINKQTLSYLLEQVTTTPRETADQKIQRIFSEKQKMYENMTAKPVLPKPSELFQEPEMEDDGTIQNIDERLSRMLEERNKDYEHDPISVSGTSSESSLRDVIKLLHQLNDRVEKIEHLLLHGK